MCRSPISTDSTWSNTHAPGTPLLVHQRKGLKLYPREMNNFQPSLIKRPQPTPTSPHKNKTKGLDSQYFNIQKETQQKSDLIIWTQEDQAQKETLMDFNKIDELITEVELISSNDMTYSHDEFEAKTPRCNC